MNKWIVSIIAGASMLLLSGCTVSTVSTNPGYSSTYVYSTGYRYPYYNTGYYGTRYGYYGSRYYGGRYYYGNRYYGNRYYGRGVGRGYGLGVGRVGRFR